MLVSMLFWSAAPAATTTAHSSSCCSGAAAGEIVFSLFGLPNLVGSLGMIALTGVPSVGFILLLIVPVLTIGLWRLLRS